MEIRDFGREIRDISDKWGENDVIVISRDEKILLLVRENTYSSSSF